MYRRLAWHSQRFPDSQFREAAARQQEEGWTMNRWDHFDVIVTVGMCATIFGATMFFFAFGGAPSGLLDQRFENAAPVAIDQGGMAQAALGDAIVQAELVRQVKGAPWGYAQERLGGAIVATTRAHQARTAVVAQLRDEARKSLDRIGEMIQETAGLSLVQATQRMVRAGNTDSAQLQFIETLGRIRAGMILKARAAMPLREEFLGWTIVGRMLSMEGFQGQAQHQLGSAVRDAGIMTAAIEDRSMTGQESLGSAVLVASAVQEATASGNIPTTVTASTPGVAGLQALHEVPYAAGVLLVAGFFVMMWGLRSVSESGSSLPTYGTAGSAEDRYRKAG
jgi:hypothetical protein